MKLNKQSILCSLQQMKIAVRLNKKEKQTKNTKKRYILCLNEYVYIYIINRSIKVKNFTY